MLAWESVRLKSAINKKVNYKMKTSSKIQTSTTSPSACWDHSLSEQDLLRKAVSCKRLPSCSEYLGPWLRRGSGLAPQKTKVKTTELYIKKPPKAMPAKPKGADTRNCNQLLTGEKHSPYSALKKEWGMSLPWHSASLPDSNETGRLMGEGYGRCSAGAGLDLGTEPKFCSGE